MNWKGVERKQSQPNWGNIRGFSWGTEGNNKNLRLAHIPANIWTKHILSTSPEWLKTNPFWCYWLVIIHWLQPQKLRNLNCSNCVKRFRHLEMHIKWINYQGIKKCCISNNLYGCEDDILWEENSFSKTVDGNWNTINTAIQN